MVDGIMYQILVGLRSENLNSFFCKSEEVWPIMTSDFVTLALCSTKAEPVQELSSCSRVFFTELLEFDAEITSVPDLGLPGRYS